MCSVLYMAMLFAGIFHFCGAYKLEVQCERYELLNCGDSDHKWMFCKPSSTGYTILNARLDIRIRNRFCRRNGVAENFGLSSHGDRIWTNNYCYGTFLLCLGKEAASTIEPPDSDIEPTRQTTSLHAVQVHTPEHTVTGEKSEAVDIAEDIARTMVKDFENGTEKAMVKSIAKDSELETASITVHMQGQADSFYQAEDLSDYARYSNLKFWLIFAVIVGGVALVAGIALITYLTVFWDARKYNMQAAMDHHVPDSRGNTEHPSYSRAKKHSTSTVISMLSDAEDSIYACIPIPSNSCDNRPAEVLTQSSNQIVNHDTDEQTHLGSVVLGIETEVDCSLYSVPMRRKDTHGTGKDSGVRCHTLSGHGFREQCKGELNDGTTTQPSASSKKQDVCIQDDFNTDQYDRLLYRPRRHVSDSRTYSHLSFGKITLV